MRLLYLDNFRGFDDSCIPLKKVNFLVGENSTGKSSVLSIIQLLSSFRFWFDLNFNTEVVSLGTFEDIVSVSSKDKTYFNIGIIDKSDKHESTIALSFKSNGGQPALASFSYSVGNEVVKVKFAKKGIYYKRLDKSCCTSTDGTLNRFIKDESSKGFKLLKELGDSAQTLPLIILTQEVSRILNLDAEDSHFGQLFSRGSGDEAIWLAPIRTAPERIYGPIHPSFSPEGSHTPHLIKSLLAKTSSGKDFKKFIDKFGIDSGLFDSLATKKYGTGDGASFELDVELFGKMLNISTVGYGVSQSLPIVVECFAREKSSYFSIQQPEVHLHPKAQAALGDLFYFMSTEKEHMFLIETHSDYIIDRFRLNLNREDKVPSSQILFFEQSESNNHVIPIEIREDGSLSSEQPKGYRDFFIKEEMQLLDI